MVLTSPGGLAAPTADNPLFPDESAARAREACFAAAWPALLVPFIAPECQRALGGRSPRLWGLEGSTGSRMHLKLSGVLGTLTPTD